LLIYLIPDKFETVITDNEQTLLRGLVNAIAPLNEAEWTDFISIWSPLAMSRKEVLTAIGDTEKYLYVVLEGVQRVYYIDDADREATLVFTYPPSFGGVLDSFLLQQPSKYFYETLTPSTFLRASYTDLEKLMQQHKGVETLIRKGVTIATSGILERLVELQCFSAEDRFRSLLKRSPHILQWVPHKYLANYLGMDATNFSKLMNKVKI
jgi:CRP-like cAMP-binding protein